MFAIRIGLVTLSRSVSFSDLSRVANAINLQVSRDFAPIWDVSATVIALPDSHSIPPGIWPIFVQDTVDGDYLGVHLNANNQPFSRVLYGPTWSLTASHECLEMLADPSANRLVSAASVSLADNLITDSGEKFEYLVEVCDPCEGQDCAYLIDDVLVSDFYTPRYFDPVAAAGVRYSFTGKITRPRQLLPDGYLSWVNPVTNTLQQARAFGAPEIIDLGPIDLTGNAGHGARALRSLADRYTKVPFALSSAPRGIAV